MVVFKEFSSTMENKLIRLRRRAAAARLQNPRNRGPMNSPPSITQDGTTRPAGQDNNYLINISAGAAVLKSYGGSVYTSGSFTGRVKSAVIGTTGGNIGANDGSQASYSRKYFIADAAKVTLRVSRSFAPYRFLVDGQYVDLTGTLTTATSPTSTNEYITLDFSAVGGRAVREIAVESQADNAFIGVYVGSTETVREPSSPDHLTSCLLGDSYVYGTGAAALGDGFGAVMADWLGIHAHTNSASGGTGWANAVGGLYTFNQRIANGDLALGGTPDLIVLASSYNDRSQSTTIVNANALAGLQSARSLYPDALVAVLGTFPANSGPSAATIATENAVFAAVTQFDDYWTRFIAVSMRTNGMLISGTGTVSAPTGTGNSDLYTGADATHPTAAGHAFIGRFCAEQILTAFSED